MEKELKIAELSALWNVSVPTCWNRIKKEGLTTFKKKDETNKDITYIRISDEIINKYVINEVNNLYNDVNNGCYEDLLTVNNVNNPEIPIKSNDFIKDIINLNKGYNEELKTVYNDYNEKLDKLREELSITKQKQLLLEDKANREGFYIKENNDLKEEIKKVSQEKDIVINKKNTLIKLLITIITTLIMLIMMFITWFITVNNIVNTDTEKPLQQEATTDENEL